jgi:hypothetical protein
LNITTAKPWSTAPIYLTQNNRLFYLQLSKFWRSKYSFTYYLSNIVLLWFPNMDHRLYPKCKIPWKPVPWEPSCFKRWDRETERRNKTKLIVSFRNFALLPKNDHRPCHRSSIYSPSYHREGQHVTAKASMSPWMLGINYKPLYVRFGWHMLAVAQVLYFYPVSITLFLLHAQLLITDGM